MMPLYIDVHLKQEERVVVVELVFCTSTIHSIRNLLLFSPVVNFVIYTDVKD